MSFDYLGFARRWPFIPIAVVGLLALILALVSRSLTIDSSLASLLPRGTPTLLALEEIEERIPGSGRLSYLVRSNDPEFNYALAVRLREKVETWEETRWAIDRRDPGELSRLRAQLIPREELARLADELEALIDWEECERLPGCENIDERPQLPTEEEFEERLRGSPELSSLIRYLGGTSVVHPEKSESALPSGALCSEDGTICAVDASFTPSPSNLEEATKIYDKSVELLESLRGPDDPPDLELAFSGPYRNAPMTKKVMEEDLRITSALSLFLVFGWLLLQFRGLRALLLVFLPLSAAMLITLGVVALFGLEMNLVSSFTFAILIGIGNDFGVHILMHYGDRRREGLGVEEALRQALRGLRGSMFAAAMTTILTFALLSFAHFRGLSQLGAIAAIGVGLAVLVYRFLLPPLIFAFDRISPERANLIRSFHWVRTERIGRRAARGILAVFFGAALFLGAFANDARFEYDFKRINPPEIEHGIATSGALHGASGVPLYILADHEGDAGRIAHEAERILGARFTAPEHILSLSLSTFLPDDLDERIQELDRLRELDARIEARMSEEELREYAGLRELLKPRERLRYEILPEFIRDVFMERDGKRGSFAVLYLQVSGSDAIRMAELSSEIARLRERFPEARFASPSAVVGEIMPSLRRDGPLVIGLTFGILFLVTLLASRSLGRALFILVPLALGALYSIGCMGLLDLRLNFYNMVMLPVALALGIDGAIYIAWSMANGGTSPVERQRRADSLQTAQRGVLAAMMTNIGAFSSFAFAENPGLSSLGKLAFITLGSILLTTLVFFPALLLLLSRRGATATSDA